VIKAAVAAAELALRMGLRSLLSEDAEIEVVAETGSLAAALRLPAGIDVLVAADSALAPPSALDAAPPPVSISGSLPAILILVGEEAEARRLVPALGAPAWGLLPLDCSAEELLAAVKALHQGLLAGSPALLEPLLSPAVRGEETLSAPPAEALTERETQVLQLLAQGLANKQIAAALGISEHTVKFHISAVYAKLGAGSRTEAVRLGVRQGLIVL
jgi:DNA-binding NarL/FixJ family response regulator